MVVFKGDHKQTNQSWVLDFETQSPPQAQALSSCHMFSALDSTVAPRSSPMSENPSTLGHSSDQNSSGTSGEPISRPGSQKKKTEFQGLQSDCVLKK